MKEANDGRALLLARVGDLFRTAERHEIAVGPFLTPGEQYDIRYRLALPHSEAFAVFYGGYDGCERARIVVLPAYLAPEGAEYTAAFVREALGEEADEAVSVLRVSGSGYKALSHRDYMGSLLALGLERDRLGDILVMDDCHALVFCGGTVASFLEREPLRIGKDAVKVERITLPADFVYERKFEPISDTVASPRLDSIVASLIRTSREKAQDAVRMGLVELNYEVETRNDRMPAAGAVISVRGYGKFRIRDMSEQTKKGRYRLRADKYI